MADRNLEHEVDSLSRSLDEIRGSLGKLTGRASDAAGDFVNEGSRHFERARGAAGRIASGAGQQVRHGASIVEDTVADRPLISLGAAFVAGVVLTRLLTR